MKKYVIFLFVLFFSFNLNAEGHRSKRRANHNYNNLKVYAKVLDRFGKSDFYLIQIDIVNSGNSTVSFWETTSCYDKIFAFSAAGILFINENDRLYFEKKIPDIPAVYEVNKKVSILPHQKYTIKTQFYIKNRENFLKTNNNLRVFFHFFDANLQLMEDVMFPKVTSDTIDYKW